LPRVHLQPTVLYYHHHQLTPAGPYKTPPRRSCETLEPSSIGAPQHPRVLPDSVTHRSLLCSIVRMPQHDVHLAGQGAGRSGFWLNCRGCGRVRAVHSCLHGCARVFTDMRCSRVRHHTAAPQLIQPTAAAQYACPSSSPVHDSKSALHVTSTGPLSFVQHLR
jgi:hypothetical protein